MIKGNIDGLKKSILNALEELYDEKIPKGLLFTQNLINKISEITEIINREIAVYVDSKGNVCEICVGDSKKVSLKNPDIKRKDRGFKGLNLIHTHPGGNSHLSELDISTLKDPGFDIVIAVGVSNGKPIEISASLLDEEQNKAELYGPFNVEDEKIHELIKFLSERISKGKEINEINIDNEERAFLVGLETSDTKIIEGVSEALISIKELDELAKTAGAKVVDAVIQKRKEKDSAFLIGQGKLLEIKEQIQTKNIDLLIIDDELSGSQLRNIEEITGVKTIDRSGLILDIFAKRAKSREGRVQVELAQLNYHLPRLTGKGTELSRLGGGIGTRGPGETKLESDRRHIRRRIDYLKKELEVIKNQRNILRREREKNQIPVAALIGYTNAGKSTLLNTLCNSDVLAEDKLFATLDTTTRKLYLNEKLTILLSDTVGFIRKLPHHLVDAFKATLEEAVHADLLLIVVDSEDPFSNDHIRVVDEILTSLNACEKPSVIVWNKCDKGIKEKLPDRLRDEVFVSALTGEGLNNLKETIISKLEPKTLRLKLEIPFNEGAVLSFLHENSEVVSLDYTEVGSLVEVEIENRYIDKVKDFCIKKE